jgi:poly(hydroxyalkanoate) granule-associated protein
VDGREADVPTKAATREVPYELVDAAQKMWLAGLGVVTLAQEEGGKLFETLIDAGKQVEKAMPSASVAIKGAAEGAEQVWAKFQELIDAQITAALHRLGVPTKDEIDRLTQRIEQLTESIEALRARS